MSTCADCGNSATTTTYAGHKRTDNGMERVDLPACHTCAVEAERDRAELVAERGREWWSA